MKIRDLLYKAPEMTEEKLLELIKENLDFFKKKTGNLYRRIQEIHKYSEPLENLILKEFDLIQEKKSYLTKSQRDIIEGFVGHCLIMMAKANSEESSNEELSNGESDSIVDAEIISEA